MKRIRKIGTLCLLGLWLGLTAVTWLHPPTEISASERRKLAQFPDISLNSLLSGTFTGQFETYTQDQFPLRDGFRQLKSRFHLQLLGQLDNNDIYISGGYAAKIEYPLNDASLAHATERLNQIYSKYLADSDCDIFLSIVPDKGYFLAKNGGWPTLDYAQLVTKVTGSATWADYVNLFGALSLEDYYKTDTHWRQEKLLGAAAVLWEALDIAPLTLRDFEEKAIGVPFYGVYRGQAALPMEAETIITLRNPLLDNCRVFNYETNSYAAIYDETKLTSRDLYDVYLSGAAALLRIENPSVENGRELIVFRDSFGSSMVPLLVHGYERVTLVDTRYVSPDILGQFIDFHDQDVLFLYSTTVLNNSSALK